MPQHYRLSDELLLEISERAKTARRVADNIRIPVPELGEVVRAPVYLEILAEDIHTLVAIIGKLREQRAAPEGLREKIEKELRALVRIACLMPLRQVDAQHIPESAEIILALLPGPVMPETPSGALLSACFDAGFAISAEGWNAEHGCDSPGEDPSYLKRRAAAIRDALAKEQRR